MAWTAARPMENGTMIENLYMATSPRPAGMTRPRRHGWPLSRPGLFLAGALVLLVVSIGWVEAARAAI